MADPPVVSEDKSAVAGPELHGNQPSPRSLWEKTRIAKIAKAIWSNTDDVTKWIQVAALVFAASWTYLTFRETEAPSLESPAHVSDELKGNWRPEPAPGSCSVSSLFGVANQGVQSFDVADVRVRLWRINLPARPGGYLFVDIPMLEGQYKPLADFNPTSPLTGHYAPKTDHHAGFTWIFYAPPSNDLFLSQIDAFDKAKHLVGQASEWSDQICVKETK